MTQNIHQKRPYVKPIMKVYQVSRRHQLLQASLPVDPTKSPYQW